MWPPNDYGCRCEGIQHPGKTKNIASGKDYISQVFTTDSQLKNFAVNRAETGVVFNQNQMYINQLSGDKNKNINEYTFNDYGLKKIIELQDTLKPIKLDSNITPENVHKLFNNNASTAVYNAMGFNDYLGRKLILKELDFKKHLSGDYVDESKNRHQLFGIIKDIITNPSEVYLRTFKRSTEQIRYIKFYMNESVIVDCEISNDGLEIKTWFINKAGDFPRAGLLIN